MRDAEDPLVVGGGEIVLHELEINPASAQRSSAEDLREEPPLVAESLGRYDFSSGIAVSTISIVGLTKRNPEPVVGDVPFGAENGEAGIVG